MNIWKRQSGVLIVCEYGNIKNQRVKINAKNSHTGAERFDVKPVDSCIAPIVKALNDAEIWTTGCCCGHGNEDGFISLYDGTNLVIKRDYFFNEDSNCCEDAL